MLLIQNFGIILFVTNMNTDKTEHFFTSEEMDDWLADNPAKDIRMGSEEL